LTAAAADIDMRQDMMVEDEYYSIIKEQESKLYYGERKIAEMNVQLAEMNGQLAEMNGQLTEMNGQLAEKDGQLAEKDGQLAEKDGQLAASIKLLLRLGQSKEMIANTLGITVDDVERQCE
jgi:uncharacterized phage infection (PIP) family protein YhgE